MDRLSARLIEDAVVYPTIRVASRPGRLLMGVFDGTGAYVDGTVLDRRAGEQGAPAPRDLFDAPLTSDRPEAIYAGPLYFHYGHFLLESLARAWYASQHPTVLLVWAGAHTWQGYALQRWQEEILDVLQIGNPRVILADPTRFERLHVPGIGYRYDDWFHPQHAAFLARHRGPAQVPGSRLWLSRSRVGSRVRDLNSAATERRLAAAGWTIAYPERLSVRQQLDHLSRAETVAGEEGSAFHSLVLLADVAGKKFHILRRHGPEHGSLHTIGRARGVDQSFHSVPSERVLSADGRVVLKLNPNSSETLDLLGVPVPARWAAPSTEDRLLQQALAGLEPRSVLDVGCRAPHLIVGCIASTRVAVSPRFDFDPRSFAGCGVDFYELGLRRYLATFHDDRGRFDVVRVAGPDLGRTLAAFRLSHRLAHARTIWVLGIGEQAARTAVAVRLTQPGFEARRLIVGGTVVYLARRVPGGRLDVAGVSRMSDAEIRSRTRWLPLTRTLGPPRTGRSRDLPTASAG